MKKIDKLILTAFFGPFFLTFFVVIFILLSQFMLRYFDEIVGKDLGFEVIAELIFYFSIFMTQNAFPLAVLLSSLMTFGNLGEHFELTAIKGAGISLVRALLPIFVFSSLLTILAYFSNNYVVPRANLKAFSLLYDVKQKKPSMELKQGTFYNGIDGYSIKVNQKFPDDRSLKDLIIYDHTKGGGNRNVILADSGQMYNIMNNRYLILELFNGRSYSEQRTKRRRGVVIGRTPEPFVRNEFQTGKLAFDLTSFNLKRTKEELFAGNKLMKNTHQLRADVDSMKNQQEEMVVQIQDNSIRFFSHHLQDLVEFYRQRTLERNQRLSQEQEQESGNAEDEAVDEDNQGGADEIENEIYQEEGEETESTVESEDSVQQSTDDADSSSVGGNRTLPTNKLAQSKLLLKQLKARKAAAVDSARRPLKPVESDRKMIDVSKLQNSRVIRRDDQPIIADTSLYNYRKHTVEENIERIDSLFDVRKNHSGAVAKALTQVRNIKNHMTVQQNKLDRLITETNKFDHERFRKLSYAVTILIMFLIGAPLGAIIKRGGLGIPVLISMAFFILFYVISMICEKWTRQDVMDPFIAAWMANILLLPIGLFFLRQAKNDARLFDLDFYSVILFRVRKQWQLVKRKMNRNN